MLSRSTDCDVPCSPHATWQIKSKVFVIFGVSPLSVGSFLRQQTEKSKRAARINIFRRTPTENEKARQQNTPKRGQRGVISRPKECVARHPHRSNSHRTPKKRNRLWTELSAAGASESLRKQVTIVLYPHKCHQRLQVGLSFRHGGNVSDDLTRSFNVGASFSSFNP